MKDKPSDDYLVDRLTDIEINEIRLKLPELEGTPKQIAQATLLRDELRYAIDRYADQLYTLAGVQSIASIDYFADEEQTRVSVRDALLSELRSITSAQWFIDTRDEGKDAVDLLRIRYITRNIDANKTEELI